jgi:hypothetical protein
MAAALLVAGWMAYQAAAPAEAGHHGGPKSSYSQLVYGNSSVRYNTTFVGGYLAEVTVIGCGNTNLDLYVYDEFGNLIAYDTFAGDVCYVSWVPRWTGHFTIVVTNRGAYANWFDIYTN